MSGSPSAGRRAGRQGILFVTRSTILAAGLWLPPSVTPQVLRDSAGIRIAENPRPLLPPDRMWRVGSQPILSIGPVDTAGPGDLLRVMGGVRFDDGRVVVGDQGSSSLRFFDARGRFLRSAGRDGDGPGEFRQILGLRRLRGDSLAITDLRRIHLYGPDGGLGQTIPPGTRSHAWPWDFFADGSYLEAAGGLSPRREPRRGQWIDSVVLVRVRPRQEAVDALGSFPLHRSSYSAVYRVAEPVVFGPRLRLSTAGGEFYAGFPAQSEVRVFSAAGRLIRVVRWASPAREVPREAREAYRRRFVSRPNEDGGPLPPPLRERTERRAAELDFADRFPAYSEMRVDRTGHLWLRQYEPWEDAPDRYGPISIPTPPGPTWWEVFTPVGGWLGRVELPAGLTPFEIGSDYVLGLWRDADEAEYVRIHRLIRP